MGKLFRFLTHCPIKRLNFEGFGVHRYCEKQVGSLLQILIPESPKAIELNERLKREITQKQREKLHSWQICKIENNIKNEIELKYNTFDANELNEIDDININTNKKYKYQWSTRIEILSFDWGLHHVSGDTMTSKQAQMALQI